MMFMHWCVMTYTYKSWWCHEMETFSALLAICAGNSPVTGEFPAQRPVMQSFDIVFDLRLKKKQLNKQSWGWWFETLLRSLRRHCNAFGKSAIHVWAWFCCPLFCCGCVLIFHLSNMTTMVYYYIYNSRFLHPHLSLWIQFWIELV